MRRVSASPRDRLEWLIVSATLLGCVVVGRELSRAGTLPVLVVFGVLSMLVIGFRPAAGLYACYPLLLLLPYDSFRLDLPVFHSPLQIVVVLTLAATLARRLVEGRRIPTSRLYLPLAACVLVLALYGIAGHGPVAGDRLLRFVQDLWPLVLIPLLVRTPRQARNVLVALAGSMVGLAALWLPGLLALAQPGNAATVRAASERSLGEPTLSVSLLGLAGSLSYVTLVAMALVAPVLLAVGMSSRRWRALLLGAYGALAVTVLAATYASAVVTLAVGTLVVVGLLVVYPARAGGRRYRGILALLPAVAPLALFGLALPPAQEAIQRILHPATDVGGSVHLFALTQGSHAFLSRPLTGFGAFDVFTVSPTGWALAGHNSFIVMAYEFGLVLLVPFVWLLVRLAREYISLFRGSAAAVDRGLAVGFLASFLAAIVTGFITPVFGDVMQDSVIWTFAGLALVWNSWRRADPNAVLVA